MRGLLDELVYTDAMLGLTPRVQVLIARTRDLVASTVRDSTDAPIVAASRRVPACDLFVFWGEEFATSPLATVTMLLDLEGNVVPFAPGWRLDPPAATVAHARILRAEPMLDHCESA